MNSGQNKVRAVGVIHVVVTEFGVSEMSAEQVSAMNRISPEWTTVLSMSKRKAKKRGIKDVRKRLKRQMRFIEHVIYCQHREAFDKGM